MGGREGRGKWRRRGADFVIMELPALKSLERDGLTQCSSQEFCQSQTDFGDHAPLMSLLPFYQTDNSNGLKCEATFFGASGFLRSVA